MQELRDLDLARVSGVELPGKFDEILPATPDAIRRDLGMQIDQIRSVAVSIETATEVHAKARRALKLAEKAGDDLEGARAEVARASAQQDKAAAQFRSLMRALVPFRNWLRQRLRSERRRLEILREAHEEHLGL